jgi:glycosyltransferase involved in cell wall biosynthesis
MFELHPDLVLFTATPESFSDIRGLEIRATPALGAARTVAGALLERIRDQLTFERQLRQSRCDVVYYPYTHEMLVRTFTVPQVITVHDLIPVIFPEHFPLMSKQWKYFTIPAVRRASAIITDAGHTKNDLVRLAGVHPDKIHVVPLGFRTSRDLAGAPGSPWERPYLLYVSSSRYPYKNIVGLCEAFALIRDRIPHDLVIVGKSIPRFASALSSRISALHLDDRVRLLEELDATEIARLYGNAALFVYPSKYEGFGIPPLEAMSHRIPVIAARAATIPEVCGDGAHYFDPDSIEDIAGAILAGLNDVELRRRLIERGAARIQTFQWKRTAARVLDICRAITAR